MSLQRKNYSNLAAPLGPYSHAVVHNHTLYTSGMTAFGSTAQGSSIEEQARQIFSDIEKICQMHNTSLKEIIKVTLFVSDLTNMESLRDALFNIYGAHLPASSLIKVDALFAQDLSIEIEAMIALPLDA